MTYLCSCGATVSETLATFNATGRPTCPYCGGDLGGGRRVE